MPLTIDGQTYYRTAEVCNIVGISRNTLFAWCKKGTIIKVEHRDYRGWRLFTQDQVNKMKKITKQVDMIHVENQAEISNSSDRS